MKEAIWKAPIFVFIWVLFLGLKILVVIAGLVAVALLWNWRDVAYDKLPSWTKPWANPNDWLDGGHGFDVSLPPWWLKLHGFNFRSFYHYHALRNPANGLRSYEWLDLDIQRNKVKYVGDLSLSDYEPQTLRINNKKVKKYLCWQGFRAGMKYIRIWHDGYTRTHKEIVNIGPWWKLFTFWKWRMIEVTTTYSPRHIVIKLGWRIEPKDAHVDAPAYRGEDSGFATKALLYRKG